MHCVYVDTVGTKIKAYIALNAMYVNTIDTGICGFYKTHTHISVHNFVNIQQIFNPEKVLKRLEPGLSNHTKYAYMWRLSIQA